MALVHHEVEHVEEVGALGLVVQVANRSDNDVTGQQRFELLKCRGDCHALPACDGDTPTRWACSLLTTVHSPERKVLALALMPATHEPALTERLYEPKHLLEIALK